jgi:preprotein translocase subunit SecF
MMYDSVVNNVAVEEKKKLEKKLNIDNFKLSRIPRPGEEETAEYIAKKHKVLMPSEDIDRQLQGVEINSFEAAKALRIQIEKSIKEKKAKETEKNKQSVAEEAKKKDPDNTIHSTESKGRTWGEWAYSWWQ